MSFLQPIALFGIVLAGVPILIHLLNLMRHRRESWAAMRFLLKAKENSSRMSKIRRWLTLLSRVLAVCTLVLLMSRPLATDDSSLINFADQKPEVVMLVLDRSSSMQKKFTGSSKSLLQRGIEEFEQFAKTWPGAKLAAIETVFSETIVIDETETIFAKEMEDFWGPTDCGGNLPYTLNQALNWLENAGIGHAQILVISDNQKANWKIQENEQLLNNITDRVDTREGLWKLRFLKLQPAEMINFSLVCKSYREEKEQFRPTLLIRGNQKETNSLTIKININGDLSTVKCRFSHPSTTWTPVISLRDQPATGWISISLPEDSFPNDNQYFFTYGNQEVLKVAVRCKDEQTRKFINAVCELKPESLYLEKDFSFEKSPLNENDLLITQGSFSQNEEQQVLEFIKRGGRLVLFPEENKNEKSYAFQKWQASEDLSEDEFFEVSEWKRDQGIFANTANGRALALPYLKILQRKIPTEGESLAFYRGGESFFRKNTIGQGVVYSFSTLPNRDWSNLGEGFVLVPLLVRIFDASSVNPAINFAECGDSSSLEYKGFFPVTGNPIQQPSVNAGIYKDMGKLLAFNRTSSESLNEMLNSGELQKKMTSNHIVFSNASATGLSFDRAEVWNLFLIVMLLFLLVESVFGIPSVNVPSRSK